MPKPVLFTNARVFDGHGADCAEGVNVLVADGLIQRIATQAIAAPEARVVDVGGRTLMPRLIEPSRRESSRNVVPFTEA